MVSATHSLNYLTLFEPSLIQACEVPERFTFPFYYQPHPLAQLAANELQKGLQRPQTWQHNFGLTAADSDPIGKMFGVLVVKDKQGRLGYLAAFSGKLANSNHIPGFVPPVFDMLEEDAFFSQEQQIINRINTEIEALENNKVWLVLRKKLASFEHQQQMEIENLQAEIREQRKVRKHTREQITLTGTKQSQAEILQQLSQQSIAEKKQLQQLKANGHEKIAELSQQISRFEHELERLKKQRKKLSARLQKKLFQQYSFLNAKGERANLTSLFIDTPYKIPPAGAGECAAPKLLQYAYQNQLQPVVMAEFWWGASPKSQVRKHQHYYPACYSKCQPILNHMLKGLMVDENPLLINPAAGKQFEILYQDDVLVVINKPAEFLSVPGKHVEDSVYSRIKAMFPNATGAIIVHRLDMSTSGLMVLSLTAKANKHLQQQFIKRTVEKRYVALLAGNISQESGTISLPLCLDFDDKPRQMVCFKEGKPAQTEFTVINRADGKTKVWFYPKTGRTHQLRVHAAHHLGLNTPIVGDDHYGKVANRLHLHADLLSFVHPERNERMVFQCDADF